MKFERTPKGTTKAIYAFLVLAAVIVFATLWANIGDTLAWFGQLIGYVTPVVYGLVMAFLISPLLRVFDRRLLPFVFGAKIKPGLRRGFALLLTYLVVLIVLGLALLLILPQIIASLQELIRQITLLLRDAPQWYANIYGWIDEVQHDESANAILRDLATQLFNSMQGILANVGEWLGTLVTGALAGLTGFASGLTSGLLGLILSVYVLASHERLLAQAKKVLKAILPTKVNREVNLIGQDAYRIFSGYLAGTALDGCILGTLCFIAMRIFGWQYAVLTAVLVGLSNMIPFFGPFIGIGIGCLLQLAVNPLHALGFLIYAVVMQQVDANIITPRIVGSSVGLPPLWVVFAILLFGGLMGIAGMLIGVPLFALLFSTSRRAVDSLLRRKEAARLQEKKGGDFL